MRSPLALLFLSLCPLHGCCSMARFFCGPDKTPWISERYETPHQAVQTLFEAIRRDDAEVVYLCLSAAYRQRLGIDSLAATVVWDRMREEVPGLFVAGWAKVPEPSATGPDQASVRVEVEGRILDIDVERQAYWEIRYRHPDGRPREQGAVVPSFDHRVRVTTDPLKPEEEEARTLVHVAPFEILHAPETTVTSGSIEHAALTHRWKIANIRVQQ